MTASDGDGGTLSAARRLRPQPENETARLPRRAKVSASAETKAINVEGRRRGNSREANPFMVWRAHARASLCRPQPVAAVIARAIGVHVGAQSCCALRSAGSDGFTKITADCACPSFKMER